MTQNTQKNHDFGQNVVAVSGLRERERERERETERERQCMCKSTGKTNTSFGDCFGIDQRNTKAIPKARVCFACVQECKYCKQS